MTATAQPVLEMELRPRQDVATAEPVGMFERLALDPNIDVDKLERLMQMHERATARVAQEQFNAAMSSAQKAMRPIAADAYNPQTKSKYASYARLDSDLRPIYTDAGFGLSFDTGDSPLPEHVRVLCHASHAGGHERTYHIDMPADGKGAKGGDVMTKTHAAGAAIAYGMRYLLKMIFNVAVGEEDRDGNAPPVKAKPAPPKGYELWVGDLSVVAADGVEALRTAWKTSRADFRVYLNTHESDRWDSLKAKSEAAK